MCIVNGHGQDCHDVVAFATAVCTLHAPLIWLQVWQRIVLRMREAMEKLEERCPPNANQVSPLRCTVQVLPIVVYAGVRQHPLQQAVPNVSAQ
jgi:hypothetical protein